MLRGPYLVLPFAENVNKKMDDQYLTELLNHHVFKIFRSVSRSLKLHSRFLFLGLTR